MTQPSIPVVMTFSGHDPGGGAGIQADIEAVASMGCHAAPIITAHTVQDTRDVISVTPAETTLLIQQARAILEDMEVAAFKVGLLASTEVVEAVHSLMVDYPGIPVVVDPVLFAGGGSRLVDEGLLSAMRSLLLPLTTILTPNSFEARTLAAEADNLDACAHKLLDDGCEFVLITGTHENTPAVENRLYSHHRHMDTYTWERLPASYHGSGCTLAAAIAGLLAQGGDIPAVIEEAQTYTWETLRHGYRVGMGQLLPNRLFWAVVDEGLDQ